VVVAALTQRLFGALIAVLADLRVQIISDCLSIDSLGIKSLLFGAIVAMLRRVVVHVA